MAQATVEKGSPRELAERLQKLPDGEYRVLVQRVRSRADVLAVVDGIAEDIRTRPDPALAGKSDDQVMDQVNAIIDAERARDPETPAS